MSKLVAIGDCFGAHEIYEDMFDRKLVLPIEGFYDEKNWETFQPQNLDVIEEGDVVMLGGGADISPSIYTENPSRQNGGSLTPSRRDVVEIAAFKQAQKVGAGIYGICRGAQMACALSGGVLIQHVTGHQGNHFISTRDGHTYLTSSVHHQMMWPFLDKMKDKFELIGWTHPTPKSKGYVFADDDIKMKVEVEPEVIWFNETRSLGIQGHPEFMTRTSPFVTYSRKLIEKHFLTKE
jgi:gamma-glutamyl-gamma-aminobutyrate hydrolase PuuD